MNLVDKKSDKFNSNNPYLISQNISFFKTVWNTVNKDLIIKWRYKADLIGDIIRSLMFIGVFALFSISFVFKGKALSVEQTLLFFITGFMLIIYDSVVLWTPLNSVTTDLYNGTLEYLYTSPNSRLAYYIGNIVASAIISSVYIIPIILLIKLYYNISLITLFYLLITLLFTLFVLISFGVMFALLGVMYRQVSSIANVLNTMFQFLGGFLFPVTALPLGIQFISYVLPFTWGIDIIRTIVIDNWIPLLPIQYMISILVSMSIIYWILTVILLKKVENYAKKAGLHLI